MNTPFFDGETDEPWTQELIEPVARFLRTGIDAVHDEPDDDDFDVDGLLRRAGFLPGQPYADADPERGGEDADAERDAAVVAIAEPCRAAPAGVHNDSGDAGPVIDEPEVAAQEPAPLEQEDSDAPGPATRAGRDPGLTSAVVLAVAAALSVSVVLASVLLGGVAAMYGVAATAATLFIGWMRRSDGHGRWPGDRGPSKTKTRTRQGWPYQISATPWPSAPLDGEPIRTPSAQCVQPIVLGPADPLGAPCGDHSTPLYAAMMNFYNFDPVGDHEPGSTSTLPAGTKSALLLPDSYERMDYSVIDILPSCHSLAGEVEQFLASPAANELWLDQTMAESRRALQVEGRWTASVARSDHLASTKHSSVQELILMRIRAMVEDAIQYPARDRSRHHVVLVFESTPGRERSLRYSPPLFSGRRPCTERLLIWADRGQWAVARQSVSGRTSVVTHLSAAHHGAFVLDELMQTYSELVVSPAAVLC